MKEISSDVLWYLEDLKTKFDKIKPEEYYLSYSGGKDSHFLLWFIKEYAKIEGIEVVGFNTYMEHPEIAKRMRDNADVILIPKMKPHEIKEKYGSPTFSKWQDEMIERYQKGSRTENTMGAITGEGRTIYKINNKAKTLVLEGELHKVSNKCCKILKKDVAKEYEKKSGKKPIVGVRGSESRIRGQQYKSCFTKIGMFTPLHDLTDKLMDKIYLECEIEIPKIYDHIDRTGCMGCPYGRRGGNTQRELDLLEGSRKKYVVDLFKETYELHGIRTDNIDKK